MSVSDITDAIENKVASDGSVDRITLLEGTGIISKVGSVLYGFMITIILILVPIVVTLEVIYICFPVIRNKIDDLAVKVATHGVAQKTIEFTLGDAMRAVKEAETTQTGKSALWIYLVAKLKSIMFIAFILALVLKGSGTIVNFVARIVDSLLGTMF